MAKSTLAELDEVAKVIANAHGLTIEQLTKLKGSPVSFTEKREIQKALTILNTPINIQAEDGAAEMVDAMNLIERHKDVIKKIFDYRDSYRRLKLVLLAEKAGDALLKRDLDDEKTLTVLQILKNVEDINHNMTSPGGVQLIVNLAGTNMDRGDKISAIENVLRELQCGDVKTEIVEDAVEEPVSGEA